MPKLVRQRTNVGSAPSRGKYAYKRKGAYRKKAKRQFKNARRPFVETKTRNLGDVLRMNLTQASKPPDTMALSPTYDGYGNQTIPLDDAYTGLQLSSFNIQEQGLQESKMLGNSIYVKYIKAKIQIQFPPKWDLLKPAQLFLVHGWVTTPTNWTDVTNPTAHQATPDQFIQHLNDCLRQYFNDKQDMLQFRPKSWDNGIKVIKTQKIVPDIMKQFSTPLQVYYTGSGGDTEGAVPNVNKSCSWTVNRKVHYQLSNDGQADFLYPNMNWIPFMCIYNPDFRHFTPDVGNPPQEDGNRLRILMNNQTWYSDS